jgi:cytochrome c-type biogenesis protein
MNLQEPSAVVAIGLGLWTAVQPCPMTANLAAVAYLDRRAGSPKSALAAALLYAAGQVIAYTVLAWPDKTS